MPSPATPAAPAAGLGELAALGEEAAAFARAGIPLEVGLGGGRPGGLSARLAGRLAEGRSLEQAWEAERGPLPAALGAVLASGVRAGDPGGALAAVAGHAAMVRDLRGELASAAAAPLAVVAAAAALTAWVLPPAAAHLADVMTQAGAAVPGVVRAGAWVEENAGWWRPLAPVAAVLAVVGAVRLAGWRAFGSLPGLAAVRRELRRATCCHLLGLLTGAGVPLGEAVRLAAGSAGPADAAALRDAAGRVDRGEDRAAVFTPTAGSPPLGPLAGWALAKADAADLPAVLLEAAALHGRRARAAGRRAAMLWPALATLVVGGGVALLYTLGVVAPVVALLEALAGALTSGGPR